MSAFITLKVMLTVETFESLYSHILYADIKVTLSLAVVCLKFTILNDYKIGVPEVVVNPFCTKLGNKCAQSIYVHTLNIFYIHTWTAIYIKYL